MDKKMNFFSGVLFLISSLSLLYIPFMNIDNELPNSAYIVASIFWIGLISGTALQIALTISCKKLNLQNQNHIHRIPLFTAGISFIVLLFLIIIKSQSSIAVIFSLFFTIVSLQTSVIIKRKGCLK